MSKANTNSVDAIATDPNPTDVNTANDYAIDSVAMIAIPKPVL